MQNFTENEKEYREYLKNKRAIIVGPAEYLNGAELKEKIDKYDIIIRLNNSYPINNRNINKDIGSRTDILYHTGALNKVLRMASKKYKVSKLNILENDYIKWFVSKRSQKISKESKYIDKLESILKDKIKIVTIKPKFKRELIEILKGTDPNMSTLSIMHLLNYDIKKLRIIGCDFYGTGYNRGYFVPPTLKYDTENRKLIRKDGRIRRKPKIPHNIPLQVKFLLKVFEIDERVKIDEKILKIWRQHIN